MAKKKVPERTMKYFKSKVQEMIMIELIKYIDLEMEAIMALPFSEQSLYSALSYLERMNLIVRKKYDQTCKRKLRKGEAPAVCQRTQHYIRITREGVRTVLYLNRENSWLSNVESAGVILNHFYYHRSYAMGRDATLRAMSAAVMADLIGYYSAPCYPGIDNDEHDMNGLKQIHPKIEKAYPKRKEGEPRFISGKTIKNFYESDDEIRSAKLNRDWYAASLSGIYESKENCIVVYAPNHYGMSWKPKDDLSVLIPWLSLYGMKNYSPSMVMDGLDAVVLYKNEKMLSQIVQDPMICRRNKRINYLGSGMKSLRAIEISKKGVKDLKKILVGEVKLEIEEVEESLEETREFFRTFQYLFSLIRENDKKGFVNLIDMDLKKLALCRERAGAGEKNFGVLCYPKQAAFLKKMLPEDIEILTITEGDEEDEESDADDLEIVDDFNAFAVDWML